MRTASGVAGREQFRHIRGDGCLPPVGQRAHGERGDFIGRVRERGDGAFHDRRRGFKRTIFERVGLRTSDAAEQRGGEDMEETVTRVSWRDGCWVSLLKY